VKGQDEATRIFALLGGTALKQSKDFIDLAQRHGDFLARYRAKDWDGAEALARECAQLNTARLDHLYELYRDRIAYFRINPPPADWDGTAEAMSK
jgi:adenylate cyclase